MRTKLFLIIFGLLFTGMMNMGQAQVAYGGGIFYGSYLRNLGLDLRVEYALTEDLILAPKLDISLPEIPYGPTFLNELCLHAHYIVFSEDMLSLYPLAGLNIQSYIDVDRNPFDIDLGFGLGLCGGVGGQLHLSNSMSFFGEARYAFGRYHQFVATAGILFTPGDKAGDRKRKSED